MPNHVYNKLEISGSAEEIADFVSRIQTDDEGDIEIFESLYPTPGMVDGLKWQVDNWGSKWGDYDTEIVQNEDGCLIINFTSAWLPPLIGVEYISKMFPSLTFVGQYDEPGYAFLGAYSFRNGEQLGAFHVGTDEYPYNESEDEDEESYNAQQVKVKALLSKGDAIVRQLI